MPFSRYQIRNEFNLADPEVYKAADRDDPEALLEGVAMAGLVGVLRQLGDLAEFAAEIFHGLHEEVMVTASRGHGLLTCVQQIESDFHSIEKVFLSQTRHSAFFTRAGIRWHPNLQTEQNLITKGDVPRFVMDSYEECRGPPQLFLLDKFDVAGAGACLKRYTDPSAYKLEAPSYEMMKGETQRDKKIHNAKKKGSRWKNGEAPDVFQLSHVKLHQLLLEERVQNGASNPARRAKLKKRESKFPFYTDTGKRYMENLLNSPPEDKLVHEVKVVNSSMHLSTNRSEEREVETFEVRIVNSPLLDDIEEKHISVHGEHKDVFEVDNQSDNMASETDNYMDALATMESEFETDVEFRAANADPIIKQETFSNSNIEQFKSQFSDSQSASDDKYSSTKNQIRTFSYSDSTINSPNNMSPRSGTSPHAFAITEIPFRPRVLPTKISDDCIEVSNNADLLVDQETVFKDTNCNESDLSPKFLNNLVDVGSPAKKEETEIDPEEITASVIVEDNNSNCTFVNSHVEEQPCVPSLDKLDICLESISDPAEARISYSSKEETELGNTETASVDSESQNANVAVCEPYDFESNEIKDLATTEQPGENRSVISASGIVQNSKESVEKKEFSDRLLISPELDSILSAYYDHSSIRFLDGIHNRNKNHIVDPSTEKVSIELGEKKESSEESVISPELGSISSRSYDHSNLQNLDSIHKDLNESDVDNSSTEKESISFGGKKESSEKSLITLESDYMPSASYNLSNLHLDSMSTWATCNGGNGNDVENPYESLEIVEDETIFVTEETDQNGLQLHVSPDVDFQSTTQFVDSEPDSGDLAEAQESKSSKFVVQDGQIEELEAASSIFSHSVPIEENADQLETLDSHNHVEQDSVEPSMINTSKFLPKLAPINMEEMPPLPPLPPMEWRLGKLHNPSLISPPDGGQHDIHRFPPSETRRSLNQNEVATKEKSECDYEVNAVNPEEKFAPQPPFESVESQNDVISGPEITWLSSTSSLPSGDDEMPNSIRPMKIQRPRTPLIDAVATHDKNKLRKLSERAMPLFPKEEERNTFLEQIRAKSFNLKPAVKSRPIIPGPTTNLRVAAILEKANAIRQAFAGSDDDEDDNDSWSDS